MQLTFLGTCAGTPSLQRNVTSIALTLSHRGDCWLFDCGEATQHQFMRSALKPGKLQKIFITHLHGDHIFGLPGLLTSRSMGGIPEPLTIYGPPGLRQFVETALSLRGPFVTYPWASAFAANSMTSRVFSTRKNSGRTTCRAAPGSNS